MKPIEEGMEALSHAVQSEVRAEADQILADAKAKAEETHRRAQEQAEAQREEILRRASQEATRIRSQVIATTQLKARTMQLERREKLLNDTFLAAQQKLPAAQQWKNYPQLAQNLLREALIRLAAPEVRVRADEQTRTLLTPELLAALQKELNIKVELGEPLPHGTGVVVETPDGHRQYDNTLESRSRQMQNELRAQVYRLLMGESL